MPWSRAGRIVVAVCALLAGLLVCAPAGAAAAPPAVSHLTAVAYDHTIKLSWYNPAAAYAPGASVIVRMTRGRTPAGRASEGYGIPVTAGHDAVARPLTAGVPYTFAVWVRSGSGQYSARRTLTASTKPDVTAPGPLAAGSALGHLVADRPTVTLSWSNPDVPDLAGVRVVRNTSATPTGGDVLATKAPGTSFTDNRMPTQSDSVRYWYYLAAIDTTGHSSPYVLIPVYTPRDPSQSAMAGTVRGTQGHLLSDIAVQQGDDPPWNEGQDPPVYDLTDSHGTWTKNTVAGGPTNWSFFAGYAPDGPDPDGLPVSHRPTGYLTTARQYPVQQAGEFRTVPDDVVIPPAGAVEGTVRTPGGSPLSGVLVESWLGPTGVRTDSSGHYLAYGLTPGTQPVLADGTSVVSSAAPFGYSVLWTGNADSEDHATGVTTTGGQATHLDIVLAARGKVVGTVTPAADVSVQVFDRDADFDVATLDGGSWSKLVRPGDYTVCATHFDRGPHGDPMNTSRCWDGHEMVAWNGQSGSLPAAAQGAVHVTAATTTAAIPLDVTP